MSIRRARVNDATAVVALFDEAADWLGPSGSTTWRAGQVTAERIVEWMVTGRLYVADQDGSLVGTVRVAWEDPPTWGDQPPEAGYIHSLVTARSVAGQGIGRALLDHAEGVVRASGRPLARLDHVAGNARLARYYQEAGYAVVGRQDHPPGRGHDSVVLLEKVLSSPGS